MYSLSYYSDFLYDEFVLFQPWKLVMVSVMVSVGLSKNRRDDGTTTGQDEASLPQLAAISSPQWRDGADDGTVIIAN